MASKRMFALTIIDSDAFLDMPQSTQLLYFHLGMRADDDGFINNAKTIMRIAGCKEDDLKLLIAKKFIICFENGIMVIKHWNINNYIQKDRYHETKYIEEKQQLNVDDKGAYTFNDGTPAIEYKKSKEKPCTQNVYTDKTRLELDKTRDSIVLDKISKDNKENKINREKDVRTHDYKSLLINNIKVLDKWDALDCDTKNSIYSFSNDINRQEELSPELLDLRKQFNKKLNDAIFGNDEEDDDMPF